MSLICEGGTKNEKTLAMSWGNGKGKGSKQLSSLEKCSALFAHAEAAWKQLTQQRLAKGPFKASHRGELEKVYSQYYQALQQGVKLCKEENDEAVKNEMQRSILEPMMSKAEELNREIKTLQGVATSTSASMRQHIASRKH